MDKEDGTPQEMELKHMTDEPERPVTPVVRHQSDHGLASRKEGDEYRNALSTSTRHLPIEPAKRHVSIQSDDAKGLPRTSTQLARKTSGRKSLEFDVRTDGPFGRPSLSMVRRESLQPTVTAGSGHEPVDGGTDGHPIQPEESTEAIPLQLEPPPLNYDLWSRRWWIVAFWSLVIFDSTICPIALYFGLWYGLHVHHKMTANTVFSIVTAAVGGMSIIEYFLRLWKLLRKKSTCRVIGSKWWWADTFHWNFTLGWVVIMVELIVGTVQEYPPRRLLTMVVPTMFYVFAVELLILDILRYFEIPAPIRLSSIPKGAQVRPGIYALIEDVVAVDGSGGTVYREALNTRYEASHIFRAMLRRLGLFWSIGSISMATVCTILIFTVEIDAAYTIGWSVPFIWAGVWAAITTWYVKRKLKEEKIAWREALEAKGSASV